MSAHSVNRPAGVSARVRGWGQWIPQLPFGWTVRRLSSLARPGYATFRDGDWIETPYITTEGVRLLQTGNIGVGQFKEQGFRYVSSATFHGLNCTEVLPGDILICRLADPVGRACLAPDLGARMITSVDVVILKPRSDLDSRFFIYWLSSAPYLQYLDSISRGGTRERVSRTQLGAVPTPVPDLMEQRAIADYLDRETTRMDALIEKKQRVVDLVDSRRRIAIEQAILRDARASVPLRRFVYEVDKRSTDGSETLLSVSLHLGVVPRNEMTQREGRADDTVGYKVCRQGDLVLNRMRAFQGAVGVAREDGIVSPDYAVLRPVSSGVHSSYLHHLLRTPWFVGKLASIVRGIGSTDLGATRTPRVNVRDLLRLTVPDASYEEQEDRANEADRIMVRDSAYQSLVDRSIQRLIERRQALITATVTGQLDIPEAA